MLLGAALPEDIEPYIALMVAGLAVGAFGHLFRSRLIVAVGVIMVFLATLLFPIAIHLFEERPESPPGPQAEP
jgi:cyanate permease